jgi:hypothetical protein
MLRKEEWHVKEGGRKTRVKDDGRAKWEEERERRKDKRGRSCK